MVEENEGYGDIIGSSDAPYLNQLARQDGSATRYDAGDPAPCPSLPSYLMLTSGSDHHVCDDNGPGDHPLTGDNLFQQVAVSGQQWRVYAESMPAPCTRTDTDRYAVRHTAAPYYVSETARCDRWDLPLGTAGSGALVSDLNGGALPAFSLVVPDVCDDMHGGPDCPDGLVAAGDAWLKQWITRIMDGPDYRAGRLLVIITWDESSSDSDNHIPTLVISPGSTGRQVSQPLTHCSTLRTVEDLLRLPALGCAAQATSYASDFGL